MGYNVRFRRSACMSDPIPTDAELRSIVDAVGTRLRESRDLLVTAESCTGGWIAKTATDIAGSSDWFDCGMVAYTYEAKQALPGVRAETLEIHGAVSRETVVEMVSGALVNSGATVEIGRADEHTSELQSLMRISYAVFCLKKKNKHKQS